MSAPRRPALASADLAVAAALAVGAVLFWKLRIIDPATQPLVMLGNVDFYTQILPMSHRAAAWLRSGTLPLWNPYQCAGHPFLAASIYGVLYPPNLWYVVLPTPWAIEAVLLTHLIAAGVLTYAFARSIALPRPAAAVAAITYMLSGYMAATLAWFPPAVAAATWLPLALLAIERIVERRTVTWACVLAAALALPFLAGWPQTWLYFVYAAGAYACARLLAVARAEGGRALGLPIALLAFGFAASLGLIAVQLLPSRELQALGPRRSGTLSLSEILVMGLTPVAQRLADLVDVRPALARDAYVGITALLLMPLAAFRGGPTRARTWCFAALAAFALGGATDTPLFALYGWLPGFLWFRLPRRVLVLWAFAAAMLAGLGTAAVVEGVPRRGVAAALAGLVIVSLAASRWAPLPVPSATYLHFALAAVVVVAALVVPAARRRVLVAGIMALVVWDLATASRNAWMHPIHNPELLEGEAALFDYIKEHQGLDRTYLKPPRRMGGEGYRDLVTSMGKQGSLREIYSITDYEPLSLERYDEFYQRVEGPSPRGLKLLVPFTGWLDAEPARPEFRMLDLLSVRFLAIARNDVEAMQGLVNRIGDWRPVPIPMPGGGRYSLFERTAPLPRAYVAFESRAASTPEEALDVVSAPGFDPRRTVVLEDGSALTRTSGTPIAAARIVAYEPDRVVIETDATEPGLLVLTDTHYPGWRASVDGATQPIVRANYLFRAVAVTGGHHVVTFEYAPTSFRLGAALTLVTLAVTISAAAGSVLLRRRAL